RARGADRGAGAAAAAGGVTRSVIARRAQRAEAISCRGRRLLRGVYPWARRRRDPRARNDAGMAILLRTGGAAAMAAIPAIAAALDMARRTDGVLAFAAAP